MTENKRSFPIEVLVSLTTGKMLCEKFSDIHGAADFISGCTLFTHHFAIKELWHSLRDQIFEHHPDLKDINVDHVNNVNYLEFAEELRDKFGAHREMPEGDGKAQPHPLDGIPDNKKKDVIPVIV